MQGDSQGDTLAEDQEGFLARVLLAAVEALRRTQHGAFMPTDSSVQAGFAGHGRVASITRGINVANAQPNEPGVATVT
jgi:hypothetical protein